jgi:hypothetical protein
MDLDEISSRKFYEPHSEIYSKVIKVDTFS